MQAFTGSLNSATTAPAPRIEPYLPDPGRGNGLGLVIFPGGGYGGLAEHEGKAYAEFFRSEGIASFVVTYRLGPQGHRHPAMLEDALAAIGTVRQRAGEFGVNPATIGVIGSSAGGHLAAHTLVAHGSYRSPVSLRPDFGILCYPVIAMTGAFCHTGSRANLLGENPTPDLMRQVSCEEQVSAQAPPCFLWHTWDDAAVPVENSLLFAAALRRHGIPFELHVYHQGPHGLGLNTELAWSQDCLRWLQDLARTGAQA